MANTKKKTEIKEEPKGTVDIKTKIGPGMYIMMTIVIIGICALVGANVYSIIRTEQTKEEMINIIKSQTKVETKKNTTKSSVVENTVKEENIVDNVIKEENVFSQIIVNEDTNSTTENVTENNTNSQSRITTNRPQSDSLKNRN